MDPSDALLTIGAAVVVVLWRRGWRLPRVGRVRAGRPRFLPRKRLPLERPPW
jgi:hypothetical protein